jgi:hypothetical protein
LVSRSEGGDASEGWWSQAGSNRRPRHCERRALPAELWPLRNRVDTSDGGQQLAPFTIRAKVKSRTAKLLIFWAICRELPLFGRGGTDI